MLVLMKLLIFKFDRFIDITPDKYKLKYNTFIIVLTTHSKY